MKSGPDPLFGSAQPLRFGAAFAAPEAGRSIALALRHLGDPVLLADQAGSVSVCAVYPAMLGRVDWFNVLGAAARSPVASVVYVLARGAAQRLVDEAVNPSDATANPDKSVALGVLRAGPKPALSVNRQTPIQS